LTEPLIEIKNLEVSFSTEEGVVKAVNDISFKLEKGETLGIVGESGSGKSVTSLSIMRLISVPPGKISGGEILFLDEGKQTDLLKLSEKQIRLFRGSKIAMIFQEPMTSLNPVYKCGKQITEIIKLHKKISSSEAKKQTLALFEEVLLPRPAEIYNAYPHQLSGGQKQRVMIAMAISCNPLLLIADEPTTALDVTVQKTILELLKQLQQKYGMSIIFITHDLGVIAQIAKRVLVMYKGKIVEEGNVQQIFQNPQHPYTKGLIACRPSLEYRLKRLPVVGDFMKTNVDGNIENQKVSVQDYNEKLIIKDTERKETHQKIYSSVPLLKVKNLCTYFPMHKAIFSRKREYLKAVDDVSFDVFQGETLGLVGESGCGKTTLGRSVLRLIEPTSGRVFYKGNDLTALNKNELRKLRKKIQIIFQDPYSSLNPRITIGAAIMEPMRVHDIGRTNKERRIKAIEMLEKVDMKESHFSRYPHEFSGGQRQRICIARTLAVDPEFIICDESVSALDVSVQAQVLNLLNDLKRDFGLTYIFISHDLSVVKFMSDRMIVMKNGRIEEAGDSDEIYKKPSSAYTQKLIDAIPLI
jgi:peptide/nickel transport system ATP-binding protein